MFVLIIGIISNVGYFLEDMAREYNTRQGPIGNDCNNGNGTGDNSGIGNANTVQVDMAAMITQLIQSVQNNNTE